MAKGFLVDLSKIDISKVAFSIEEIRGANPQRYEMEQLSWVVETNLEEGYSVGVRRLGDDEFWCRGHIPGRPIFPGVLMVEAAAQLCSFHYHKAVPDDTRFFGFGGIDAVKFRGEVRPGDTLVIVVKVAEMRTRRVVTDAQAFVDDRLVFQGRIIGMPM